MSLIAICALFAAMGSACMPPEDQFAKPIAAAPTPAEPVVLNGAGGKVAAHAGKPASRDATAASAAPAPAADPSATGSAADGAAAPPAGPVLAAKPLPPKPDTPAVAAAPADPSATPADEALAKDADGYPNINMPPKEPAAALMPADERARVISELEALRKKGPPAGGGTQVAKKAGAKKADGKCPDGATPNTDPDCKASDQ